jgi:DNA/RNA-binding domain of Phe-tRNA-synthetase-like protein
MTENERAFPIQTSSRWHAAMPGAVAGILVLRDVRPPQDHAVMNHARVETEASLKARFAGRDRAALRATPPLPAYVTYYRRFGQTYHVLLQAESIALKGKSLPRRPPLVEAMFLAELESLLLTAGHDAAAVTWPVVVDVAGDGDRYVGLGGNEQICKPGDMVMRDAEGIFCSIVQGPDDRTRLTDGTIDALFAIYAPPGIGPAPVRRHLERIVELVRIVAPDARASEMTTLVAGDDHAGRT